MEFEILKNILIGGDTKYFFLYFLLNFMKKKENKQKFDEEEEDREIHNRCFQEKLELHKKAELFETRINDGKEGYEEIHPAKSAEMASNETNNQKDGLQMEQEEEERFHNYTPLIPFVKIPSFWEKRIWDDDETKMDPEEEKKLIEKIEIWNEPSEANDFTFNNRNKNAICPHMEIPSNEGKRTYRHSVHIPKIKSCLDTDDTDTDNELLLE